MRLHAARALQSQTDETMMPKTSAAAGGFDRRGGGGAKNTAMGTNVFVLFW